LEDDLDLAVRIGSLIATRIGPTATSSARARPSRTSSRRPGRSVWSTPASGCCRWRCGRSSTSRRRGWRRCCRGAPARLPPERA